MKIAFLGVGRMGRPMASRLAAAGYDLVLFNRTRSKADELAAEIGAVVASTPCEAADGAEVVITMLADSEAVRQAYLGDAGAASSLRSSTIAVDMGTTGTEGVAWLDQQVRAAGAAFVDAPVSGSTTAAAEGELMIMAGGPAAAVEHVRPILAAMGRRVFHLGPPGSGAAMKLAVNGIIYALGQAVSEALVLAERFGIDRTIAYDVIESSAAAAPMVMYRHDQYVDPQLAPVMFAMDLALKDLRLIRDLASELGVELPQVDVNVESYDRAVVDGFGDRDMASLAEYLRSLIY